MTDWRRVGWRLDEDGYESAESDERELRDAKNAKKSSRSHRVLPRGRRAPVHEIDAYRSLLAVEVETVPSNSQCWP